MRTIKTGVDLKPIKNRYGYMYVNLRKDGVTKQQYIHRLVAQAFIPNPNNLPEVNHKDEDKTNNNVKNLEWCDRKYNINYGTRTAKFYETVNSCNIKKEETKMLDLKKIRTERNLTQQALADQIHCARTVIANIEIGLARPSVETAKALGSALGVNWWEFFEEGGDDRGHALHGSGSGQNSED